MSAGGILVLFASICVGASLLIALLFHYWPRYGSVEAAIAHTDQLLEEMESGATEN